MEGNGKTPGEFNATGAGLVSFWSWAAEKGLLNKNTAGGLRKACEEVLGVLDGWESADLRALDLEDPIRRFQNLKMSKYTPESMKEYIRRFRLALPSYLQYLDNPTSWKWVTPRERPVRQPQSRLEQTKAQSRQQGPRAQARDSKDGDSLIDYVFPLLDGRLVHLKLPADFKISEVPRLAAFLKSLAVDFQPDS